MARRRPHRKNPQPQPQFRPRAEALEPREVPAVVTWDAAGFPTGGDFSVAANWLGGVAPTAADDAVINLTKAGTVGYNLNAPAGVGSITTSSLTTFNVNKGTLTVAASPALGVIAGPVSVASGATLAVNAGAKVQLAIDADVTVSGTLSLNSPASFVAVRGNGSQFTSIVVGTGGILKATDAVLTSTGKAGVTGVTRVVVSSGASFKSVGSTFGWDLVSIDASAFLSAGDVTTSAFDAALTTPAKYVPHFVGNKSFRDVNLTVGTNDPTLNLAPLGVDSSLQRYVFPSGTFTVAAGTALNFTAGAKVLLDGGATVTVNGTLSTDSPASFASERLSGGIVTAINVGAGGQFKANNAAFTSFGKAGASGTTRILLNGGNLRSVGSTFGWDQLTLGPASVAAVGDVTTSAFDTTLTTPAKYVPVFVGNKRFQDVNLTGTTLQPALTLDVLGADLAQRYVFPAGTFTVAAGTALGFGPGTNVLLDAGAQVSVNGTLALDAPAGVSSERGGAGLVTAVNVNSGGLLKANGAVFTSFGKAGATGVTRVQVNSGGTVSGTGNAFVWDAMTLAGGSTARLQHNFFDTKLNVSSGTNLAPNAVRNNDFTGVLVVASGATGSTIDLTNNYWGSSVAAVVDGLITDKLDTATLPLVNYLPLLANRPVQTLSVAPAAITYSVGDQTVPLSASFRSPSGAGLVNVSGGTVTFSVLNGATVIGTAVTVAVSAGAASTTYTVPGGTNGGTYTILAEFSGSGGFTASFDNSQTLTINPVATATVGADATRVFTVAGGTVSLSATVTSPAGVVGQGAVVFTLFNGAAVVGSAVSANVTAGAAAASYTLPASLTAGTYTIQSAYGGTANLAASTGAVNTLTVTPAASTTTAANRTANFSGLNQAVSLTATVTSPAGTVNGGQVTFTVRSGATVVGTVVSGNVVSGAATASYTLPANTPAGTLTIEATYGSPNNFSTSTDATKTLTVNQAATTTAGANASAGYGLADQNVTLTATVTSPGGVVAAGSVTFTLLSGAITVGTPVTVSVTAGAASGTYVLPAGTGAGSYTVQVVYVGSANFVTSTATNRTLTVAVAPATALGLDAAATFAVAGQSVNLTAGVTSPVGVVGQGSVTFTLLRGATVVGTAVTVVVVAGAAGGPYALPANLAAGSYTVRVAYVGLPNFASVTDATHVLIVAGAVSASAASPATTTFATAGQSVTLTATITSAAGVVGEGTALFTVLSGVTVIGSAVGVTVVAGSASASYALPAGLAAGAYTLRVSYTSAGNFLASTNDSTLTLQAATTGVVVSVATATYVAAAHSVTLTATVTSGAGVVSQGSVLFSLFDGVIALGSPTTGTVSGGTATVSYPLPAGTNAGGYRVEATYAPSTNFTASSDLAGALTVSAAATSTASAGPSVAFSTAGQAVTLTATLASVAGVVNAGGVTFRVLNGATLVGSATVATVTGGVATTSYTLPPGLAPNAYVVEAVYGATTNFATSTGAAGVLTVLRVATTTAAANATTTYAVGARTVNLSASVTSTSAVGGGSVTFTLLRGATPVGSPVIVAVVSGLASATYAMPAGTFSGSYTIRTSYGGTANLAASTDATRTLTVAPAATTTVPGGDLTVPFAVGVRSFVLTAGVTSPAGTVSSGQVRFTVLSGLVPVGAEVVAEVDNGTATVTYTLPAGTPVGGYTVRQSYLPDANFLASLAATQTLSVQAGSTAISLGDVSATFAPSAQDFSLTATVTSLAGAVGEGTVTFTLLNGSVTVGTPVTLTVTAGVATATYALPAGTPAGDYALRAVYSGTANLLGSGPVDARLSLRPAPQTVTFAALAAVTYGTATLVLGATGGGSGQPVAFTVVSGPARVVGMTLTVTGAGEVVLSATQPGTNDYLAAPAVPQRLTVRQASLTLTANDARGTAGQPLPALGYRVDGLVNGDTPATVTGAAVTTAATPGSPAGGYPIRVVGGAATNYTIARADGTLTLASAPVVPPVVPPVPPVTPPAATVQALQGTPQFAVGTDAGSAPTVRLYNPDGTVLASYPAFDAGYTGGVRTAAADLTGTGAVEVIVGTGPGTSNRVRVLRGTTGAVLADFQPFEPAFEGGVFVTTGDLNADGVPDLVVTPDQTGGPIVVAYDGASLARGQVSQLNRFFGIEDPDFRGGARAAVGLVGGRPQVIVSAGFGGGPRIAVFDGRDVGAGTPKPLHIIPDFFAFEPELRNGAYVAAGDITGGGSTNMIFGAGPGGGPRVRVFDSVQLIAAAGAYTNLDQVPGAQVANFFAGDINNRGGVRVGVKRLDATNRASLVVGAGTGAGSRVTAYTGAALLASANPTPLLDFDDLAGFAGGVFVG